MYSLYGVKLCRKSVNAILEAFRLQLPAALDTASHKAQIAQFPERANRKHTAAVDEEQQVSDVFVFKSPKRTEK